ncbi:hypothetical protein GALMADRAFT_133808 [Galerina marginata CBS 339.88]|uniref:Uncharacterized protein n=1 Tax=Galerina marginata (strain CBS 339.88) TaxID=685588 RepID=A0A067TMV0_GALM3|nr:hypothetical protein GALMADRAFT_133808 [Galerina marginata CBS 339.88]
MEALTIRLGQDILWYIFVLNANMEHESEDTLPAITTLLRSSQVCSTWRNFINACPSLWARVVNFDWLQNEDWRNEVIRRTGRSDLFIRGGGKPRLKGIEDAIILIVVQNWPRMRSLDLDFEQADPKSFLIHDSDVWRTLRRPSKILESFQWTLLANNDRNSLAGGVIFSPPEFSIFDNSAPSLRVFIAPNINFSLQASWISQLRRLALNAPIHIGTLLEVLNDLPLLESFEDQDSCMIAHPHSNQLRSASPVVLPHLKEIIIYTTLDIEPSMGLLAKIRPLHGCLLSFYNNPGRSECDPSTRAITAASEVLSSYSGHAELAEAGEVTLSLLEREFVFAVSLPGTDMAFDFAINCCDHLPDFAVKNLFTALKFPDFHHIRVLKLRLRTRQGILHSNPKITEFCASVSSVETLDTTTKTLQFLLRLPGEALKSAFPVLRKVVLHYPELHHVPTIQTFLAFRTASGTPVSTLSIYVIREADLTSLDEFTGLIVAILKYDTVKKEHFKVKEYICGSGRPTQFLITEPE